MIVHIGLYKSLDLSDLKGWIKDYYEASRKRILLEEPLVNYNEVWSLKY